MKNKLFKHSQFMTGSFLCLLLIMQNALASEEWEYTLEPYALFASISGDTTIGRTQGVDIDVNFGDILENLKLGGMVHFEALRNNEWGMTVDYGFMKLGSDVSGERGGVLDADVRQGIFELWAFRRFDRGENYFDLIGGVRWWDIDIDVEIVPALLPETLTASVEEDWVDPFMGVRWWHPVSPSWKMKLRADIGGFGITSDFTATLSASAYYKIKENMSLEITYKALWVDYEDGNPGTLGYIVYDTVSHGPLIGLAFKF